MINTRQTGRRRGRGGQRQQNGRAPENTSRIDNRARGNAAQLLEKYKTLARDAQQGGDRVLTEYYLQFADHYFRVLSENRSRYEEAQSARRGHMDGANDLGDDADDTADVEDAEPYRAPRQTRVPATGQGYRTDGGDRERPGPRGNVRDNGRDMARDTGRDSGRDSERPQARWEGRTPPRPPMPASAMDYGARDARDYGANDPDVGGFDRGEEADQQRSGATSRRTPVRRTSAAALGRGDPDGADAPRRPARARTSQDQDGQEAALVFDANLLPPAITPPTMQESGDAEAPPVRKRGRPRKVVVPASEG